MLKESMRDPTVAWHAVHADAPEATPAFGWRVDLPQALRQAAGLALAIVAPDGRLLHLEYDVHLLVETIGAVPARQVSQWLETRQWLEDLLASTAFERAVGEGMIGRQMVLADGSETMLEQSIIPLSAGATGPLLVTMREMSDWHRYAHAVERLSRFYEVTLNTMAEGILGIDGAGAIDFVNPAAARLLGWPSEELIGCAVSEALGTDSYLEQPEGIAGDTWFMRRHGEPFAAEFRLTRKREDDTRQGAVLVFADISARKTAERELHNSNVRLYETMEALQETQQQLFISEKMAAIGRLAAGIAHEINTPLAFVGANLRSMESYAEELLQSAEAQRGRGTAENAGDSRLDLPFLRQDIPALCAESRHGIERIAGIVHNLRTFSQVDIYREWGLADLNAGLDSTVQLIAHEFGESVEILRELGELPLVECQAGQINQVFLNLLSNAVRAVGERGCIWLRSGHSGNQAWLEIADNGCGIAPEHQAQLFEPFFTTRTVGQGTGLGLSVAYGIVKRHGGQLSVVGRAGGGSVFRLVLPVMREAVG